eukprot:TRINITY_DN63_c2_g1_i1.p3 TRINITY_DN63_c2_g1~~TRINITY_DN63_c2_g1_i1.p3  ORF type:complete len:213 (-),score=27.39 TRINITY_DN63_c2_g1_i1:225-863(-)
MPWNATRPQWRDTMRSRVFPRMHAFKPDLIFISAGFDAHEKEDLAFGFAKLIEFDFSWITKEVQKLANLHCEGRVISVLEGGYNTRGGVLSPLAQSVNFHVAELRSRSRENYVEPTVEELEQSAELDRKLEETRIKGNEIMEHERVQRMKRARHELGENAYELIELNSEDALEESEEDEESQEQILGNGEEEGKSEPEAKVLYNKKHSLIGN